MMPTKKVNQLAVFGVGVFLLMSPSIALSDVTNLTCVQTSFYMAPFTKPCTEACRTFELTIDMMQGRLFSDAQYEGGSYVPTITESGVDWDSEDYHYHLYRYTGILLMRSDPKHGEEMLDVTYTYKCNQAQRQF